MLNILVEEIQYEQSTENFNPLSQKTINKYWP